MNNVWNPWHGCKKYSAGCLNCYVYRIDQSFSKTSDKITKNKSFEDLIKRDRQQQYKIKSNQVIYVCLSSDFFLEEADQWRDEAWCMLKQRSDIEFVIITKRVERVKMCLPEDFGKDYQHITLCVTMENQSMYDKRYPILKELPFENKKIICEPLLENIELNGLDHCINEVIVGGESGNNARVCDYSWVFNIAKQCQIKNIKFTFKQTGHRFIYQEKLYRIPHKLMAIQAKKAQLDT